MSAVPLPRAVPSARRRTKAKGSVVMVNAIGLVVLAYFSFVASSLLGQVALEKARRAGIEARDRTRYARNQEAVLRARIENLQSLRAIDQWARLHGFIAPDQQSAVLSNKEGTNHGAAGL